MARPAPAVTRALQIIELLVTNPDQPLTISEIAARTELPLGTAHAVLAVLEGDGYLVRHPARKTYTLGPALLAAGVVAFEQHPAIAEAARAIGGLAAELEADMVVTAPTPSEIVFVAVAHTRSPHGPGFRVGERVPLVPPLGAVFMAWSSPEEIAAWLARAPAIDPARAERMLEVTRARGYALSLGSPTQYRLGDAMLSLTDHPRDAGLRGELDLLLAQVANQDEYELTTVDPAASYDLSMIAAPIFDADRRVLATIVASGFPRDLKGVEVVEIAERIRATSTLVTKETRGRLPV